MSTTQQANPRSVAATVLKSIIDDGKSLDRELDKLLGSLSWSAKDPAFCKQLVFGVCRYYWQLDDLATPLLSKPIRRKDRAVYFLILVGLYQIRYLSTAQHAAVSETVDACAKLKQRWARGLVNACLRRFIREQESLTDTNEHCNHPEWMVEQFKEYWPDRADEIMRENNLRAPMCLRVNTRIQSRQAYQDLLAENDIQAEIDEQAADGLILSKPCGVEDLPGFFDGAVSVQDTAAQLCADLLPISDNSKVLDCCAAPGGKSAHLLERSDNAIELTAIDVDDSRCARLRDTFQRLNLDAKTVCMDSSQLSLQSDHVPEGGFDIILLDAPCSGTGVIRRHPDIKHHRTENDIKQLCQLQARILDACWSVLAPGGTLLYATCSVLPQENEHQISAFMHRFEDIVVKNITDVSGISAQYGIQSLAGIHNKDGFYYCLLEKSVH